MAQDRSNLYSYIRDLRANFVKRYLSLGLNEAHRPNLDINLDHLQTLKENDLPNQEIWSAFTRYFKYIDAANESHEDYSIYREIIALLKSIEEGESIDQASATQLVYSLTGEIEEEEEISIEESAEPDAPESSDQRLGSDRIFTIDSSDLPDFTPLKSLILDIDNGAKSLDAIFEQRDQLIQYVETLNTLNLDNAYQHFNQAMTSDDADLLYRHAIQLLDLYSALSLELPIDLAADFETLYADLFIAHAHASFYDALLSIYEAASKNPNTLQRKSTQRNLESLHAALKTDALYQLDPALLERIEADNLEDAEATHALIGDLLQSINHEQQLLIMGSTASDQQSDTAKTIEKDAKPAIEAAEPESSPAESQTAKTVTRRHPYYLEGFIETPLRERPDYDDDLLGELKESYTEEVQEEIFPTVEESLSTLQTPPYDQAVILDLRRAFHTLKGSGYMAGFMEEGEIAWLVEQVLNGCRDGHYEFNPAIWHHANDGYQAVKSLLDDQPLPENELERIAYQANYLIEHKGIIEAQEMPDATLDAAPLSDEKEATIVEEPESRAPSTEAATALPHPYYLNGRLEVTLKEAPDYDDELLGELKESYLMEVEEEVFPLLTESLTELKESPYEKETILNLRRAFHTLKGSGYMAGFMIAGEIAWQVEQVLNSCRDGHFEFNTAIWHHANDGYNAIKDLLEQEDDSTGMDQLERIAYQATYLLEHSGIIEPAEERPTTAIESDLATSQTEVESAEEPDLNLTLEEVESHPAEPDVPAQPIIRTAKYDLSVMQSALDKIKALYEHLSSGSYHDLSDFATLCGDLTNQSPLPSSFVEQQLIEALQYSALMHRAHGISPRENILSLWNSVLATIQEIIDQEQNIDASEAKAYALNLKQPIITYSHVEQKDDSSQAEDEIYELFSAEAVEILELADELINDWQDEGYNADSELIAEFRRHMHTLKGSARMVGKTDIGQLAHAMESLLDPLYISRFNSDPKQFDLLQRTLDHIPIMLESKDNSLGQEGHNLLSALHLLLGNETPPELDDKGNISGESTHTDVTEKTSAAAQAELSAIRVSPISLANISEDIAENLILDTQQSRSLTQINNTIEELERTIARVNAQTRRIEIEMEAQMLSRHARLIEDDDFDPLELDRFTELQQITRFISESVADLNSLCENIQEQTEDLDINLEKQKALHEFINHSLNEIRTVSFLSIVPRLRRLIRQVSKEHDKKVELVVKGADIQAERSIVEQMVPPFEHMIRNSIIHGLETPDERDRANKPSTGKITLEVVKEEAELLIRFNDDGRGINIEKVRERVIEMGEVAADANLSDQEIVDMLMLPGMSTAGGVSQDAGRGVGLDVLAKAILLLNAEISILNHPGNGLTFEIRIPFALSTINALIVRAGEKFYALPLSHIIAVERHNSRDDENNIIYQDQPYKIYNLTSIYRDASIFSQENQNLTYLLLNIDGQRCALEIDEILAHQEIIMRPLNPQIARIPGLTGASILSTGDIVYIIDVVKLFSSTLVEQQDSGIDINRLSSEFLEEATRDRTPTVLIVDDSITMRRVSSRLVERLGLQHETAKDGLDAIEKIEHNIPDLIMLDIEMPNMDGFEVLNYLRTDENYNKIPIIMITSRIGEKHKERALELGADMYCGKPYSEDEMTDNIKTLLGDKWDNIQ